MHKIIQKRNIYKWIVIDKDDYSKEQINGVISRAKNKKICIAISNESYELWLLLHFKPVTRFMNRYELKSELNRIFKKRFGIEYSKSHQDIYNLLIGLQENAIINAKNLIRMHLRNHQEINTFEQNPITTIFELVECLNSINNQENCRCFPLFSYDD